MAGRALFWSRCVFDVPDLRGQIVGLVTLLASHRAMSSFQGKLRGRVVESLQFVPGPRCVTSPAADSAPVSQQAHHPVLKLSIVRILMTCSAGPVIEDVFRRAHFPVSCGRAVTVTADDSQVGSLQGKTSRGVLGQCESRRLESLVGVAFLAAIVVRRSTELAAVNILVAGCAGHVRKTIDHDLSLDGVALCARYIQMARLQWKLGGRVLSHSKSRWLEAGYRVTGRAVPTIRSGRELASVGIFFVAIQAPCKCHGLFEIPLWLVTCLASHAGVLPLERIFCPRVIEDLRDFGRLPVDGRRMTRPATGMEGSLVRVTVTRCAVFKCDAFVFYVRFWFLTDLRVALFAGDLFVTACKPESGAVVIELRGGTLPILGIVARGALLR